MIDVVEMALIQQFVLFLYFLFSQSRYFRTELYMNTVSDSNSFGIGVFKKVRLLFLYRPSPQCIIYS